jgi:hypothetical protein
MFWLSGLTLVCCFLLFCLLAVVDRGRFRRRLQRGFTTRPLLAIAALFICAFVSVTPAGAVTFTVTLNTDAASGGAAGTGPGNSGDLRSAILAANSGDTIRFNCGQICIITLTGPLPPITSNLTIDGGSLGDVVIDGNSSYRVFFVDTGTVTLENLIIRNARAQGGNGGSGFACGGGGAGLGAGLFVNGVTAPATVTLIQVTFLDGSAVGGSGCTAVNGKGAGGGGGLGGNGGNGAINTSSIFTAAGGGGVLGAGANGNTTSTNGVAGGLGGGGGSDTNGDSSATGGGGGLGYSTNSSGAPGTQASAGNGGFGGGGGGAVLQGGNGGFGGGGGGAESSAGNGGAGAGGGGSDAGQAGFGGALNSSVRGGIGSGANSGGGAAAGPDIFVNQGTLITENSTTTGASATGGAGGSGAGSGGRDATPVFNYGGTVNGSGTTGPISDALADASTNTYVVSSVADTTAPGTLRAALTTAAITGGTIIFDNTAFLASNTTAQNTITLTKSLTIPPDTTIQGLTTGSGPTLRNLVTINGGGSSSNFSMFTVDAGTTAVLKQLNIVNGYTESQGGAIATSGNLTITGCTFSNNYAAGSLGSGNGGGAIYTTGGSLAISNSTFSGNTGSPGGAMTINGSTNLTISSSTFSGNTTSAAYTGAVMFINSGTVTIADSTISGNTSSSGYAIYNYDTLNVTNTIISGNTGGDCGSGGSTVCPANGASGNVVSVSSINLAPLGNYGGPTQTMIPLPGSPAICAGLQAVIPSGVATDQRGTPNTNTTYPGYNSTTACVDSGAVQTNYALSFTQQPSNVVQYATMSPAPEVTLDESGAPFSQAVTIPLTLTGTGTLSGNSEPTVVGVAPYPNLNVNTVGIGDSLTASLVLNPNLPSTTAPLTLTDTSNSFNVTAPAPVVTGVSPASGNATGGTSVTITGTNFTGATSVSFGGTPATGFIVNSATSITAISPAVTSASEVDVTVTTASGTSVTSTADLFTYNLATPTLSFAAISAQTYGASTSFAVSATSASSGAVTYTVSGPATISGNTMTITGAGTITITANQLASEAYGAATATTTVTVAKAALTVVVNSATKMYGTANPPLTGTVTGLANGDTTVSVGLAYSTTATQTSGVGTYPITVTITNANYSLSGTPGTLTVTGAALNVAANNATKIYGTVNPAFSGNITGGLNGDTFTASYTTSATSASPAGQYAIVPSVTGANLADYSINATNGTLTIAQASSSLILSWNASSITTGQPVVLTANVADATAGSVGTPTGSVSFYDSTTLLGTAILSNGTASYTVSSLTPGATHTLSASYAGDTNFTGSNVSSPLTIVGVLDFSFTPPANLNLTGVPSGTVTTSFGITPMYGSYAGQVNFSISGLPTGAIATFSPSSLAASTSTPQAITLTIQLPQPTAQKQDHGPWRPAAPLALGLLLAPFAAIRRLRKSLPGRAAMLVLLLAASLAGAATLTGCGSGQGFDATPSQNYTVTVAAQAGPVTHSFQINLNVQ